MNVQHSAGCCNHSGEDFFPDESSGGGGSAEHGTAHGPKKSGAPRKFKPDWDIGFKPLDPPFGPVAPIWHKPGPPDMDSMPGSIWASFGGLPGGVEMSYMSAVS
eukprot:NODE_3416_length_473_cov_1858.353774_g2747_i0.p1 GENE.NODE_3416_length_473_cov_1858.353774_g2747_i0~~NODE_3416_length_473_cov_1858.353774_g2747_i0.p1  ORF type:complete len:104 (-),score=18.02 NODE_3416_length_473_cov_1858.353774_g2747_i0:95-406(-)